MKTIAGKTVAAIFLSCSAFVAGSADAATDWRVWEVVGDWKIYYDEDICVTSAKYNSGLSLGFSLNKKGSFSISFHDQGWDIPKGNYPVSVRIDRGAESRMDAWASGTMIAVYPRLNDATSQLLRYGGTLHARMGDRSVSFHLTGTSRMLPSLYRCAVHVAGSDGGAAGRGASNPFSGGRNPFD